MNEELEALAERLERVLTNAQQEATHGKTANAEFIDRKVETALTLASELRTALAARAHEGTGDEPVASAWDVECYRDGEWVPFFEITFRTQERAERTMRAVIQPHYPMRVVPLYRRTPTVAAAEDGWRPMVEADLTVDRPWSVLIYVPDETGVHRGAVGEARWHEGDGWYWAGEDPTDYHAHERFPTHWRVLPPPPDGETR